MGNLTINIKKINHSRYLDWFYFKNRFFITNWKQVDLNPHLYWKAYRLYKMLTIMLSLSVYRKSEFQDWPILSVSHIKISNSYCGLWEKHFQDFWNICHVSVLSQKSQLKVPEFSLPPYMGRSFHSHPKWSWVFTSTLYIDMGRFFHFHAVWAKSFHFYPLWKEFWLSPFMA